MTNRGPAPDPLALWIAGLLPPLTALVHDDLIERTVADIRRIKTDLPREDGWRPDPQDALTIMEGLADLAFDLRRRAGEEQRRFDGFSDSYFRVRRTDARRQLAEEHLRATVADPRRLRGDLRALRRHLDHEALSERHRRRMHGLGQRIEVALRVIRRATRQLEAQGFQPEGGDRTLQRFVVEFLGLGPFLLELIRERDPTSPREAAFTTLGFLVRRALGGDRPVDLDPSSLREIVGAAQDPAEEFRIQRDAGRLMLMVNPDEGMAIVERRLLRSPLPGPRDDFLYRAAAVRLVPVHFPEKRALGVLRELMDRGDPSEHVRMTAVEALGAFDQWETEELLVQLGAGGQRPDPSFRVRATVYAAWCRILDQRLDGLEADGQGVALVPRIDTHLGALRTALAEEGHPVAQRAAVTRAVALVRRMNDLRPGGLLTGRVQRWMSELLGTLARVARGEAAPAAVAFDAARQLTALQPLLDPRWQAVLDKLADKLTALPPGQRKTIRLGRGGAQIVERDWGGLLAAAGQGDLGFAADLRGRTLVVQRGPRERASLARILHELRHRAPDKRQGGVHTTLPAWSGQLRAPSARMAPITPTNVPDEPAVSPVAGSWAPHLPTVADCLEAARRGHRLQLFHPHGETVVHPPRLGRRWLVAWKLRWGLSRYNGLRRRSAEATDAEDRRAYLEELTALGFRFEPRTSAIRVGAESFSLRNSTIDSYYPDRSNEQTLGILAGLPSLPALGDQAWNYLVSAGGNNALQLVAFLVGMGAVVLGDAALQAARIRRWRRSIPLVIGGWGTRGKSGTERLKAALFHAQGCEVLSKTTGSEAMLIHSAPGIPPREVYLYRPYDKASIWEQRDVLRLGSEMGVQVMLWECMALNPRYVEILALEWMKDDLSTITNCYPDHEDIQGPSGRDVASSISRFVPRDGVLVTSEQEMLPLLRQRAAERSTRCLEVDDLSAQLIPGDLLDRFPYREHPRNVALVARLASELGVDSTEAIIAMADHVVPDVGSLKVYPEAVHAGRRLTYVNGHSANDRAGLLASWERGGMAEPEREAATWIVGVVNNRADRVSRSRVFASILARDLSAHMYCLIGTNLSGFVGYLRRAVRRWLADFRLSEDRETSADRYRRLMARLALGRWNPEVALDEVGAWFAGCGVSRELARQQMDAAGFSGAVARFVTGFDFGRTAPGLGPALAAVGEDAELEQATLQLCHAAAGEQRGAELAPFVRRQVALVAVAAAGARWADQGAGDGRTRRIRDLFADLLLERVRPLDDDAASGDQVLDFVARQLPPGVRSRAMGMQNIKGTGLDFVYRWIAYDHVTGLLGRLESADRPEALEVLRQLRNHPDYGLLDSRAAHETIARLRTERLHAWSDVAQEAELAEIQLLDIASRRAAAITRGRDRLSIRGALLALIEGSLDYLHSVLRRRRSRQILDDLVRQRISHPHAAALMRELTRIQKGGWLTGKRIRG